MVATLALMALGLAVLSSALLVTWEQNRTLRDELTYERSRRQAEAQAAGRPVRGANGRYVKAAS